MGWSIAASYRGRSRQCAPDARWAYLVRCLLRPGVLWRVNQTRPLGFAQLTAVLVQQGEHAAALAMVRDGLRVQEETGHSLWDAELHRFEGIALFWPQPARRGPSRSRRSAVCRTTATGEGLRAACRDEPRAPLARPGQAPASARTTRSRLWLVH